MLKIFTAIVLTLALNLHVSAQVDNVTQTTAKIEDYVSALEEVGFWGSVLVDLNGEKVLSKGYGYSDRARGIKNTPNTVFDIGSLTKQFTATAILKLEMQGKLTVEDKISKYFADVPMDKSTITLHDLLRHQSGLPSTVGGDYDSLSESDFIDLVLNSQVIFKNGTDFSYSNIGYSLLAIIVEKVSGTSYETYLYENLWKPADMEMTGYTRPNFDPAQIAIGYYQDGKEWGKPNEKAWDTDAPYWNLKGNGGILSTTEDLYKWHKAMLGEEILSEEAKHKLYHPKIRPEEDDTSFYAYGWDVSKTDRNTTRIWHNGANNIFYADFMSFVEEEVTLIMMSNVSNRKIGNFNFELANIIFEKDYKPVIPIANNETNRNFTQEIIDLVLTGGLEAAEAKNKSRPSKTDILEDVLNAKGYELLAENKYDRAIAIFTMNTVAYPKSANAFDSLAEGYMTAGDKSSAIIHYEKSLELNPDNGNAKDKLLELRK